MNRKIAVNYMLSVDDYQWVTGEAVKRNVSQSEVVRDLIRTARGEDSENKEESK